MERDPQEQWRKKIQKNSTAGAQVKKLSVDEDFHLHTCDEVDREDRNGLGCDWATPQDRFSFSKKKKFLVLLVYLFPGLWSIGVHLRAVFTGSYVPGHHSLLLINSPNEQIAKEIGRSVMERRLAASINILPRTSTMYYWNGEIQYATEILMLVKTKTSRIHEVIDYVRSIHPYVNPEVLSFPVEDGSVAYMNWMDEAVPDD